MHRLKGLCNCFSRLTLSASKPNACAKRNLIVRSGVEKISGIEEMNVRTRRAMSGQKERPKPRLHMLILIVLRGIIAESAPDVGIQIYPLAARALYAAHDPNFGNTSIGSASSFLLKKISAPKINYRIIVLLLEKAKAI